MPEPSLLDRLPHEGPARLPDTVVSLEPESCVVAQRTLRAGDSCLNETGRLPGVLLLEMMAQVGGLLIAPEGVGAGDYAVLAGAKRVHLHGTAVSGETVTVTCELVRRLGDLYLIRSRSEVGGRRIAHGAIQLRRIAAGAS